VNAAEIAADLGEARQEGANWHCRCPLCSQNALSLRDNPNPAGRVKLLIKPWCGCDKAAVRAAIKSRSHTGPKTNGHDHDSKAKEESRGNGHDPNSQAKSKRQKTDAERIAEAGDFWNHRTQAIQPNDLVDRYLASRLLLQRPPPETLRYAPSFYHPDEQRTFPALVGALQHQTQGHVAIHAVCLNPLDPTSKLTIKKRKLSKGLVKGACIRLSPLTGPELAISTGIEDGLAFGQMTGISTWALPGDDFLLSFEPPPPREVQTLILLEDKDASWHATFPRAAARFARMGYRIKIARPLQGKDINSSLLAIGPAYPICTIENADPLPEIVVVPGERHLAADEGLVALVAAKVPFYQRNKKIVRVALVKAKNSAGDEIHVPGIVTVDRSFLQRKLAHSAVWLRPGEEDENVPIDPPRPVAAQILSMVGEWPFEPLRGIVSCPTLRRDGTVLDQQGYDKATGLFLTETLDMPPVPEKPTEADARAALEMLTDPLGEFPFVDKESESVALSMFITPVVRGAMDVAPMHLITKPAPGTGSSYLVNCAAMIATGEVCAVESMAPKYEETEKRLIGAALSGFPIIGIDNVREIIAGDFFCQVVEQPLMSLRALSSSEKHRIPNTFTVFANGQNVPVAEDMVRRTLCCALDANVEHPEERSFESDPLAVIGRNRGAYVAACLTIVRAYVAAGRPTRMTELASFGGWSRLVREPLIWLGCSDPVKTQEKLRSKDPRKAEMTEVFNAWKDAIGVGKDRSLFTKDIIEKALSNTASPFFDALWTIAPQRGSELLRKIDGKALGKWLSAHENQIALNYKLLVDRTDTTRPRWYLAGLVGSVGLRG
jgi:putative DNA primase/helicase